LHEYAYDFSAFKSMMPPQVNVKGRSLYVTQWKCQTCYELRNSSTKRNCSATARRK